MKTRTLVSFAIILLILLSAGSAQAQWTCRSKLPAFLKPINNSIPIYWASEITAGMGKLDERDIINTMVFLGLDYSTGNHQFYAEGGWKLWRTKENQYEYDDNRFGIRELFYRYSATNTSMIAGFQTITAGEHFLVNEKATGLSVNHNTGKFAIKGRLASVSRDYSRYGTFCSVRYLYDVLPGRRLALPGEELGETNFGSVVVSYQPSKKISKPKPEKEPDPEPVQDELDEFEEFTETDEFEEFSETDEFEEIEPSEKKKDKSKPSFFSIDETGLVTYSQFGSSNRFEANYAGLMIEVKLGSKVGFNNEVLYQLSDDNNALLYLSELEYGHIWQSGSRTEFSVKYYGRGQIDDDAGVMLAHTNLFVGEVSRLDAIDMPIIQTAFKHNFPKIQTHVKLQYAHQFEQDHIKEYNIAVGKTFFRHAKLTGIYSLLDADTIDDKYQMIRFELRSTF